MNTTTHDRKEGKREGARRRAKASETTGGRLGCDPSLLNHEQFAYRWINDDPGRLINKTKSDDWDFVPQTGVKEDSTNMGDRVSIVVGGHPDGSPKLAYLCRKLKTYFDEDARAAQARLDDQLEQLRRGKSAGGEAQSDYVPSSGIRV